VSEAITARVIELATTTYRGFNQQHLTEMLAEHEGIDLSRSSVRRILGAAGVPAVRRRRPPRHRSRRDRYPREGLLLQLDASRHDWLEERGPRLSLVGAIDDATGLVPWACFREQEDAHGYFLLMRHVVRRHGIPVAVYSDQHSIFRTTKTAVPIEDQLEGNECRPTQFGRLLNELGVTLILARSPQAKGRIERLWGTFQDRLTSELRLAGAATRSDAEQVLSRYLVRHNRRFTIPAADPVRAWLPWPATLRPDALGAPSEARGAVAVARFCRRARGAVPALLDGEAAIAWMPDGELRVVFRFTARDALITAIDLIADPEHLRQLDLIAPFE